MHINEGLSHTTEPAFTGTTLPEKYTITVTLYFPPALNKTVDASQAAREALL